MDSGKDYEKIEIKKKTNEYLEFKFWDNSLTMARFVDGKFVHLTKQPSQKVVQFLLMLTNSNGQRTRLCEGRKRNAKVGKKLARVVWWIAQAGSKRSNHAQKHTIK